MAGQRGTTATLDERENPIGVFVADDEEQVVDVLRAVIATDPTLRFVGAANDADAAIEGVARHRPEVALLDVRMPGGGGVHAAREIRRRNLRTKVVALSAHEDADTVIAMLGAGASAYVPKADPTDRIVGAIHRAVDPDWRDEDPGGRPAVLAPPLPRRAERGARVAKAILERAVVPSFEPVVDTRSRLVVGLDARPRVRIWPERSYDGWLADAEAEGLLLDFELNAFRAAFPVLDRIPPEFFVEFAVTTATAGHPRFRRMITSLGRRVVLGFSALDVTTHDSARALERAVAGLRSRGIGISARDVGPGVEGLRQLARLRPEHAWLDPVLTRPLGGSFAAHSVTATVVACAHQVGAEVIADGVTDDAQLDDLLGIGVRMASGPFVRPTLGLSEAPAVPGLLPVLTSSTDRFDADGVEEGGSAGPRRSRR